MIVAERLSKHFAEFVAVDGVTFCVRAGEVLALLGPNGAGKTTTVRMLTSVIRPTEGRARIADLDVVKNPAQVRAIVGVLTEQHGLYERMPAEEYLVFFGQIYGLSAQTCRERAQELLEYFFLIKYRRKRIGEFSKGMRQKLALARAMLHDPPVLLLDEPTSAMDPESARLVRDSIKNLRSANRAILICTHNLAEAEELADQIAIIRGGKIIASGSPTDLKRQLLGPSEYEIRLKPGTNGLREDLPPSVEYTGIGDGWLRYITESPEDVNPIIVQYLVAKGCAVVSLHEIPRNLEQVYLQAVNNAGETRIGDVH
jgi:ABC-2 type transport system ATP-binding protein